MSTTASKAHRRGVWSWCLYDFANSPFATIVVSFIFPPYFQKAFFEAENVGKAVFSNGVTVTALCVAFASPFLGALADRGGTRKRFLGALTLVTILGSVGLALVEPGSVTTAIVIFVIANIAFELAQVFYNAFLPDLATPKEIGRISGYGWGLGYVGGILALVVALFLLVQPEEPLFGLLGTENHVPVRATFILVAIWFAVFALPMFFAVQEDRSTAGTGGRSLFGAAWGEMRETWRELKRYKQTVRFLLARLIYNDGLVTIFFFGGMYAASEFGFDTKQLIYFGILLNVTAALGAWAFGFIDDKLGGRTTILITLVALTLTTALALQTHSETVFWVCTALLGIFVGPNQSASRSLMGRFVPPDKENEFYGFFAFSGKATAFLGPFLHGLLVEPYGQRVALGVTVVFFVVGALLLLRVNEAEGIEAAGR